MKKMENPNFIKTLSAAAMLTLSTPTSADEGLAEEITHEVSAEVNARIIDNDFFLGYNDAMERFGDTVPTPETESSVLPKVGKKTEDPKMRIERLDAAAKAIEAEHTSSAGAAEINLDQELRNLTQLQIIPENILNINPIDLENLLAITNYAPDSFLERDNNPLIFPNQELPLEHIPESIKKAFQKIDLNLEEPIQYYLCRAPLELKRNETPIYGSYSSPRDRIVIYSRAIRDDVPEDQQAAQARATLFDEIGHRRVQLYLGIGLDSTISPNASDKRKARNRKFKTEFFERMELASFYTSFLAEPSQALRLGLANMNGDPSKHNYDRINDVINSALADLPINTRERLRSTEPVESDLETLSELISQQIESIDDDNMAFMLREKGAIQAIMSPEYQTTKENFDS